MRFYRHIHHYTINMQRFLSMGEFNFISNNCIAAYIYTFKGAVFNNPFMWSVINLDDIIRLISNFDSLNFGNITLDWCKSKNPAWNDTPVLTIDSLVQVNYIHTKIGHGEPYKINGNLYVENPLIEVHKTYIKRLRRMIEEHIRPTFIINQSNCESYDAAGIRRLYECIQNTQYETHIICPVSTMAQGIYNNVYIHNGEHCCTNGMDKRHLSLRIMEICEL